MTEESIASIASGILGAILGSGIAYYFTQRAYKVTLTFDLHRELNTVEMGRHRYRAEQLLREHPALSFEQLNEQYAEDVDSLLAVFRFFQRLGLAAKYGQVHKGIASEVFSSIFYYWHYPIFESRLKKESLNGREHVVYLAEWFRQSIELEKHEHLKLHNRDLWAARGIV
jgi:hypothetical protein